MTDISMLTSAEDPDYPYLDVVNYRRRVGAAGGDGGNTAQNGGNTAQNGGNTAQNGGNTSIECDLGA